MNSAVLNLEKALPFTQTNATGVSIQLKSVSKDFASRSVLKGIDLEIGAGEFVAVVGRSGCGKSTLLRLLAGIDSPTDGTVVLKNAAGDRKKVDSRIMFQDARLLPWRRAQNNVGLGLRGDWRDRALRSLEEVGLGDRAWDWPSTLSGGQKQRVALARALVHEPGLLLLDEPLGALDALTRIEMQRLIERLWRSLGFTAVLVTHDIQEAVTLADRVLLIEGGTIALDLRSDLPRPRDHGDPSFSALESQILHRVMDSKFFKLI